MVGKVCSLMVLSMPQVLYGAQNWWNPFATPTPEENQNPLTLEDDGPLEPIAQLCAVVSGVLGELPRLGGQSLWSVVTVAPASAKGVFSTPQLASVLNFWCTRKSVSFYMDFYSSKTSSQESFVFSAPSLTPGMEGDGPLFLIKTPVGKPKNPFSWAKLVTPPPTISFPVSLTETGFALKGPLPSDFESRSLCKDALAHLGSEMGDAQCTAGAPFTQWESRGGEVPTFDIKTYQPLEYLRANGLKDSLTLVTRHLLLRKTESVWHKKD